eukprot:TRINITY_DN9936_c0_g1_i2.p1 TRINITY_DN9936_c0_g1~~TRINITY_DN9936_c0_g1_i2.p1  ORF type:complete len:674 (+),score=115.49 TRINITY_DN9936_c0_g1_i2:28-2049(+)
MSAVWILRRKSLLVCLAIAFLLILQHFALPSAFLHATANNAQPTRHNRGAEKIQSSANSISLKRDFILENDPCSIHVPLGHLHESQQAWGVIAAVAASFQLLNLDDCSLQLYATHKQREQLHGDRSLGHRVRLMTDNDFRALLSSNAIPVASVHGDDQMQHANQVFHQMRDELPTSMSNHFVLLLSDDCVLQLNALQLSWQLLSQLGIISKHNRDLADNSTLSLPTILGVALHSSTFDLDTLGYNPTLSALLDDSKFYTLQQPTRPAMLLRMPMVLNYLGWFVARQQQLSLPRLPAPDALRNMRAWQAYMTEFQRTLLYFPSDHGELVDCPRYTTAVVRSSHVNVLKAKIDSVSPARLPVYNAGKQPLHYGVETLYARDAVMLRKCTLVITVYERYQHIADFIKFYHHALVLRAIVVVWNAIQQPLPSLPQQAYRVPVTVVQQSVNSINNRFAPRDVIATDCIINMDDDWRMPHQVLFFTSRVWHYRHSSQLVGLSYLARTHARDPTDQTWRYLKNRTVPQSMVLPSGLVYHRRYLSAYSRPNLANARALVDEKMNCDDLLLNMVVANASKLPPVFVNTGKVRRAKVVKELGKDAGLWKRQQHYDDRHACLNTFAELFGGMPLKYSRWAYNIDDHLGRPAPGKGLDVLRNVVCREVIGQDQCRDDCVECKVDA